MKRGFPPIESPKREESPLVSAAMREDTWILNGLIGTRRKLPRRLATRALISAVVAGQVENIRNLVAHGANPGAIDSKNDGTTMLQYAVASGKAAAVKEILTYRPDIRGSEKPGHGVISFLLDHGVTPAAQEELLPILIRAGADVNAVGGYSHDRPMFILSANKNCPALLTILLAGGADVNAHDNFGSSPLMNVGNNVECAKALVAHGADLLVRDKEGRTALGVARDGNNNDVATIIEAAIAQTPASAHKD